jgi:hypothetical protein
VGLRITPADFDSITNEFSKLGSIVGVSLRYSDGLDDLETVTVSVGSIEGSKVGTKVSDVGRYVGDVEGEIVRTFSNVGFEVGRREGVIVGLLDGLHDGVQVGVVGLKVSFTLLGSKDG